MADSGFAGWDDDYDATAIAAAVAARNKRKKLQQQRQITAATSASHGTPGASSQHSSGANSVVHERLSPFHLAVTSAARAGPGGGGSPYYRRLSHLKPPFLLERNGSRRRHSNYVVRLEPLSEQAKLMITTATPVMPPPEPTLTSQERQRTNSSASTSRKNNYRRASTLSAARQFLSASTSFFGGGGAGNNDDHLHQSSRRTSVNSSVATASPQSSTYRVYSNNSNDRPPQESSVVAAVPITTVTEGTPVQTSTFMFPPEVSINDDDDEEAINKITCAETPSPTVLIRENSSDRSSARHSIWSLSEARRRMSLAGSVWGKLMSLVQAGEVSEAMLDEDGELAMQAQYRPESLESLCSQTKFTANEVKIMYRGFKQECPSGHVNEDQFKDIFCQYFPQGDASSYAHYVFNTIDIGKHGLLNFGQFLVGLSILTRGSTEDRLAWCFNLYDINADGYITRDEMYKIVRSVYEMLGMMTSPPYSEQAVNAHVERVFLKMDRNCDGLVTKQEFVTTCLQDDLIRQSLACFGTEIE